MRLLFINQYYWPDVAATAQQLTDLAEYLAAPENGGHEVDVLCSRGLYEDQPGIELKPRETRAGVNIHRVRQFGSRRRGVAWRILAYLGFDLACLWWLMTRGWRYHAIVTLTEPPLIGLFGVMMRLLSLGRVKHVCWSMDLYTDCIFALGSLSRRHPLGALLEWLNRVELRRANATVALGSCMRDRLIAKGVKPDRLHVIGVWNRADQLTPMPIENNSLRRRHGLEGKFVVMYSGNAGRSHTFDAICQSMLDLKNDPRIVFLFVGGGKRLEHIKEFATAHQLPNFMCLPYFPRDMLNESLAMGDAHLVSLQPNMSGVVVPCKLYGILGVARPVLFVGPASSTIACEVNAVNAGMAFNVDDSAGLTAAIRRLASDPAACRRLGENGRRLFLEEHERDVCCAHWRDLLHRVVKGQDSDQVRLRNDDLPLPEDVEVAAERPVPIANRQA